MRKGSMSRGKVRSDGTPVDRRFIEKAFRKGSAAADDFRAILEKYKIREKFPSRVLCESEVIPERIDTRDILNRLDLRRELVFTIDGEDAKDLDDAVSIEKLSDGWKLGVHIADVSYYVKKDSLLDREARRRANSFYFITRVVPMFPEKLSNGICSLNPGVDRLTLSIIMEIDRTGTVIKYSLHESIIHTSYRLTYEKVQDYIDGKEAYPSPELKKSLTQMNELYQILYKKRIREGALDLDFREQKCVLDERSEPVKFWLKDRLASERIIEEFMLVANRITAKFLGEKGISIYRIHSEPTAEKIQDFVRLALKLGHKIYGVPVPSPVELQRVLDESRNMPHKELVSQLLLRSMQQARYDTDNIGHFGLGFEYYTHFTSPIRRYADLIVHRLIKNYISKNKKDSAVYSKDELRKIADHISTMERVAMESERDFYKIKSIRFMESKVHKKFDGIITGVSSFGIFVQIRIFGVEGLVRYRDMSDDYYYYDEKNYCAIGKKSKRKYTLGDRVNITVKKVNVEKGFLDLLFETK
jgi:ribonuclease R